MENPQQIKIEILSDLKEPLHTHPEPELLYVLEGECICTSDSRQNLLRQQDILLVNSGEPHTLLTDRHALICRIRISCGHLEGLSAQGYTRFRCNTTLDTGYKYTELRKNLISILLDYAAPEQKHIYGRLGRYYLLLDQLAADFRESSYLADRPADWESDQKLVQIIQYLHAHIGEKINMSEIAEKLFMSPSSLSRFFHKKTGVYFNQYLKNIRLQKAAEALKNTDVSATRLALECGFANPSALSTDFREHFGMTPGEYRRQFRMEQQMQEADQAEQRERLLKRLSIEKEKLSGNAERISVCVDTGRSQPYKMWNNRIANIGPAYILETASIRNHVLALKEELHIEYVRIWSLFSERLMLREKSGDQIRFSKLDEIFDFCVENHLKLFLDLSPRTNVAMASESRDIYSMEEGIVFESQADWEDCLKQFCRHIVWRYGKETVGTWIFEFAFFLNARPYFISDLYSPRVVWSSGMKIIKEMIPQAKVAGPGLMTTTDEELMERLFQNVMMTEMKPDIFTSYNFPYVMEKDEHLHKLQDVRFLGRQIDLIRSLLGKYGFDGEYYITEWNNSVANRNYIQDSCYRGTFVLKNVLDHYDKVDEMGIWYVSDLLNVYYDTEGILSGSAGIITKDGIYKPAFYAFQFLSDLGDRLVERGENYIITKNEDGHIRILCFHNKNLSPTYFLVEEDSHRPEKVSQLFLNKDMLKLKIRLENLNYEDTCIVRQKIVNEEHGSILNQWIEMGCERELLPEDIRYLRRTIVPAVKIQRLRAEEQCLELHIEMAPHEMRWISIVPN